MMRLTRKGLLRLEYQAVDQKKVKTQSWYEVDVTKQMCIRDRLQRQYQQANQLQHQYLQVNQLQPQYLQVNQLQHQ